MGIFSRIASTLVLSTISFISLAEATIAHIEVADGYIREVIPTNTMTSAYMTITNNGEQAVKLVGAKSAVSPRIEIHEHVMSDGMMKMRKKNNIGIASGESAVLQPMGLHLMLFELQEPLKAGQDVSIVLMFEGGKKKEITLPVHSIKQAKSHQHHH